MHSVDEMQNYWTFRQAVHLDSFALSRFIRLQVPLCTIFLAAGITEKLDHLKDLGVGAVWLSPIYKSPMADNGYDISDFYDIDPSFGTLDDFDQLKTRAEELGEYQVRSSQCFPRKERSVVTQTGRNNALHPGGNYKVRTQNLTSHSLYRVDTRE
jgi:hypothetical protein